MTVSRAHEAFAEAVNHPEQGWLVTDIHHRVLTRCVTGPTWKSRAALNAAEAVIVSGRVA